MTDIDKALVLVVFTAFGMFGVGMAVFVAFVLKAVVF